MAELPEQRPSRVVREQVIEKLTLNYAHSNLDDDDFEERLARATKTESTEELLMLVRDLPDIDETRKSAPQPAMAGDVALNPGSVKEEGTLLAILGGASRKGVWRPPRHLRVFSFMGGVDLDFSDAEMPAGTTELTVFTVMGGVDITVPPGLNVDVSGVPLLGGFDDKSAGMVDPSAPTLKVRGVAILGGVDVKLPRDYRRMLKERRRSRARYLDRRKDE